MFAGGAHRWALSCATAECLNESLSLCQLEPSHLLTAVTFKCKGAYLGWPQSSIRSSFASWEVEFYCNHCSVDAAVEETCQANLAGSMAPSRVKFHAACCRTRVAD